jgi:hypothetical protein
MKLPKRKNTRHKTIGLFTLFSSRLKTIFSRKKRRADIDTSESKFRVASVEHSRKRRKFQSIKKYVVATAASCLVIIGLFFFWYVIIFRNKPLFISPLPIVQALQRIAGGDVSEDKERQIENLLKKNAIVYSHIDTSDSTAYSITLKDEGQVLLAPNKDLPSQIASLQVILNRLTMEGRTFKRLDLRFNKPIITFKD